MNVSKRAWDMLSEGKSVDEVRIATGFIKAVLEAMLRDIERERLKRRTRKKKKPTRRQACIS